MIVGELDLCLMKGCNNSVAVLIGFVSLFLHESFM